MKQFDLLNVTRDGMVTILDTIYFQVLDGIGNQQSIYDLADEYRMKYNCSEKAISKLITNQIIKATVTGSITGLGGIITLPVTLPADMVGSLAIQLRMIGAIAVLRGYNPSDDEVKTLAYACLAGLSANKGIKDAGVKTAIKGTHKFVEKKITGEALKKINQKLGFKFITKNGTKGVINIGKLIPFIGAPIGGTFNLLETSTVAVAAKHLFVLDKNK